MPTKETYISQEYRSWRTFDYQPNAVAAGLFQILASEDWI